MEKPIHKLYQPGSRSVPASFGPLKGANANSRVTGPCGDTMEFWLMICDGRIPRATFTTDGCGASIACGAAAARLAEGRTVEEAARLTPPQVEIAVGNLPEDHKHCAVLAMDTLQAALEQYRRTSASAAGADLGNMQTPGQRHQGGSGTGAGMFSPALDSKDRR